MPQHINLLDASFDRQREWLGSATAALAVGATLGVVVAAALTLQTMSARSLARADQLGRQLAALQVQGAHPGGTASSREADELSRLRAIEAASNACAPRSTRAPSAHGKATRNTCSRCRGKPNRRCGSPVSPWPLMATRSTSPAA